MLKRNVIKLIQEREERMILLVTTALGEDRRRRQELEKQVESLQTQVTRLNINSLGADPHSMIDEHNALVRRVNELEQRLESMAASNKTCEPEESVLLISVPRDTENKISIVKLIRSFTGCTLREAATCVGIAQGTSEINENIKIKEQRLIRGKGSDSRASEVASLLRQLGCDAKVIL